MDERNRANRVLEILKENYSLPEWTGSRREPFQTLIRTVLSQATNDRNRDRAEPSVSHVLEMLLRKGIKAYRLERKKL